MSELQFKVIQGDFLESSSSLPQGNAALVYLDPPYFSGRERRNNDDGPSYEDRWASLDDYLAFLRRLVGAAQSLLAPNGVIALQLDWRASHHARLILENAFRADAFVNEIIWSYRTGGLSKRWLGRKHDTIHVFANGPDYTFNVIKEKSYLAHRYGFSNIEVLEDEKGPYTMVSLKDVWEIPALRGNQREYLGYPTQKPLALLERLIEVFTNADDLVIDPCCGSGTTLHASKNVGRSAIGMDRSKDAIEIARRRLSM
ncbi:site-specific DNA-methyltransferase [Planctomycetota bacterium]|nr:site-specific DNA-methyltransferase [Planctomycetota bacterium]